jgi:hypothetical protein
MERKTLLYSPSGQANQRAYSNVSAPAGAFGDAGGALAGLGRDIQSVGGSVAQISQNLERRKEAEANLAARKTQDSKDKGLTGWKLAVSGAEKELNDHINAASGPGFDAVNEGSSALFIQRRAKENFQSWADETKYTELQNTESTKEQYEDYVANRDTFLNSTYNRYAKDDTSRLVQRRTGVSIASTENAFTRVYSESPKTESIIAEYDKQVARIKTEKGIDVSSVATSLTGKFQDTLAKVPIDPSTPPDIRKKIYDQLIDRGLSPASAKAYIREGESKLKKEDVEKMGNRLITEGRISNNQFKVLSNYWKELESNGQASPEEVIYKPKVALLKSELINGWYSPGNLVKTSVDQIKLLKDDPQSIAGFFDQSADGIPFNELTSLLGMLRDNVRTFENQRATNPSGMAEDANPRIKELGLRVSDIANVSNFDPIALESSIKDYSLAVEGHWRDVGYPPETGAQFLPPGLYERISGSLDTGSVLNVSKALGSSGTREMVKGKLSVEATGDAAGLTVLGSVAPAVLAEGSDPTPRSRSFDKIQAEFSSISKISDADRDAFALVYKSQGNRESTSDAGSDLDMLYARMPAQGTDFDIGKFVTGVPPAPTTETTLQDHVRGLAFYYGMNDTQAHNLELGIKDMVLRDAATRKLATPADSLAEAVKAMPKRLKELGLLTAKPGGVAVTQYMPIGALSNTLHDILGFKKENEVEGIAEAEKAFGHVLTGIQNQATGLVQERLNNGWFQPRNWWATTMSQRNLGLPGQHNMSPGIIGKEEFDWATNGWFDVKDEESIKDMASLKGSSFVYSQDHKGYVLTMPASVRTTFFGSLPLSGGAHIITKRSDGSPCVIPANKVNSLTQYMLEYDSKDWTLGSALSTTPTGLRSRQAIQKRVEAGLDTPTTRLEKIQASQSKFQLP